MAKVRKGDDWAREVPPREEWRKSPFRSYGWERRQSVLPEYMDDSVHLTPEEQRRVIQKRREAGFEPREGRFRHAREQEYFGEPYGKQYSPQGYYVDVHGRGFNEEGYFSVTGDWRTPGPYTGFGPRGYERSDERIWEEANQRLTRHGYIDASDIEVTVENNEITLEGEVEDRPEKKMAEATVETIPGVIDVHNRLVIRYPRGAEGRREEVGETGVYPITEEEAPEEAEMRTVGEWGEPEEEQKEKE